MNVLLSGVVGSTAYGLGHAGSDIDRLGVYAVDTHELHGLHKPKESHVTTNPDCTMHEIGKFCQLALKCNPTVMELLWLDEYETRTPLGDELIGMRTAFLSAPQVRNRYLGYATSQFKKLQQRDDGTFGPDLAKRTAKHARHLYRLLIQGHELWSTGAVTVRLSDPRAVMSFGAQVALGDIGCANQLLGSYEDRFYNTTSALRDAPDTAAVEEWLLRVRREFYMYL